MMRLVSAQLSIRGTWCRHSSELSIISRPHDAQTLIPSPRLYRPDSDFAMSSTIGKTRAGHRSMPHQVGPIEELTASCQPALPLLNHSTWRSSRVASTSGSCHDLHRHALDLPRHPRLRRRLLRHAHRRQDEEVISCCTSCCGCSASRPPCSSFSSCWVSVADRVTASSEAVTPWPGQHDLRGIPLAPPGGDDGWLALARPRCRSTAPVTESSECADNPGRLTVEHWPLGRAAPHTAARISRRPGDQEGWTHVDAPWNR